jgi:hypothetical protein
METKKNIVLDSSDVISAGTVQFSPDGETVRAGAVSERDGHVLAEWSLAGGPAEFQKFPPVNAVKWVLSRDRQHLFSSSDYKTTVIELDTGTPKDLELQGVIETVSPFWLHIVHRIENVNCISVQDATHPYACYMEPVVPMGVLSMETPEIFLVWKSNETLGMSNLPRSGLPLADGLPMVGLAHTLWQVDLPEEATTAGFDIYGLLYGTETGAVYRFGVASVGGRPFPDSKPAPFLPDTALGPIRQFDFWIDPDNQTQGRFAVTGDSGALVLEVPSGTELDRFDVNGPAAVAFSPDGRWLAIAQGGNLVERKVAWIEGAEANEIGSRSTVPASLVWDRDQSLPVRLDVTRIQLRALLRREAERSGATSGWSTRSFDSNFKALDRATQLIQDVPLVQLEQHIQSQLEQEGESLEVVGLRVPAGLIRRAGIGILLGLLGYFVIHMQAFPKSVSPHDSVWRLPWIALYRGRLSSGATVLSLCIAPTIASIAIAWRSWEALTHGATGSTLELGINIAGVVGTALLAWVAMRQVARLKGEAGRALSTSTSDEIG